LSRGAQAYYLTVYLWSCGPIALSLVILVVGVLRNLFQGLNRTQIERSLNRTLINNQHFYLFLLLSYIVLPAVSNKQLQVFDCIYLKSGESYLRSDTSISCTSAHYLEFRSLVVMFIIIYQCIPVLWIGLLYRKRDSLHPSTSNQDERLATFIRDNNPELAPLRFLFVDYKCSKWWFETADMYRRIVFIGILPLVSPRPEIRASFGLVLSILSVAYFREEKPYRVQFTNVIAHIAQVRTLTIALVSYCYWHMCTFYP